MSERITVTFNLHRPSFWDTGRVLALIADKVETVTGQLSGDGGSLWLSGIELTRERD